MWRTVPATAAAILLLPGLALGQQPVSSFDQLPARLKTGDKVRVTDTQGRVVRGMVMALDAGSITLDKADGTAVPADRVRLIQQEKGSKLLGLLIGFGIGAAAGFAFAAQAETAEEAMGGYLVAGVGAGAGLAVGALMPRVRDVYRAPSGAASRLAISPIVTPRTKSVVLSFSF